MLESLDQVPWSSLWHAYGSADDIPEQLRSLLDDDREVRQSALFSFTCNIFHQGSRYPATVAAIPFFIEILADDEVPDRAGILDLLAHLAVGYPDGRLPLDYLRRQFESSNPLQEFPALESEWATGEQQKECALLERQCYAEVAAGLPVYANLLVDTDQPTSIAASFLVSFFPAHAYLLGDSLMRIAQDQDLHELVRSSAVMGLGYLCGGNASAAARHFCESIIALPIQNGQPIPVLTAASTFYLLAVTKPSQSIDRARLKQVASACLKQGIAEPTADFYQQRLPPDEIESAEDYYDAFLAPVCEFPWEIEQLIQGQVLRQSKRGDQ